jgi:hypothetical protein
MGGSQLTITSSIELFAKVGDGAYKEAWAFHQGDDFPTIKNLPPKMIFGN